jgi:hypothetical protein
LQERGFDPRPLGVDRGYNFRSFIEGVRARGVISHPAAYDQRRTVRSQACALSQRSRRRIEEIFGWGKATGCFRKSRYRGVERVHAASQYVIAACKLDRMAKLVLGPTAFGGGPEAHGAGRNEERENAPPKRLQNGGGSRLLRTIMEPETCLCMCNLPRKDLGSAKIRFFNTLLASQSI